MWFQAYSGYEQINKLGWNCKKYKCQNANYLITSQSNSNFKNANSGDIFKRINNYKRVCMGELVWSTGKPKISAKSWH